MTSSAKKLGIALAGLGKYATEELARALKETRHCHLAGVITGSDNKAERLRKDFNLPAQNIYAYDTFDAIKDNPDIDIVYVVLPNALHREFVIRAARAGKHVICEKPMALTVEDCDEMIQACDEANVKLSLGYRLHFEPYNREMMRLGTTEALGAIRTMRAENGLSEVSGWRLDHALAGGGPLMDVGIYCIQGVRYTTGKEPLSVMAREDRKTDASKFRSIEEGLSWQMEMPDGVVAECRSSYSKAMDVLHAETSNGWFELKPAYAYRGLAGQTSRGTMRFPQVNQQASQMDDFALAILNNRPTPVPGEMGRQDVRIIQAIYESMRTGKRVDLTS